MKPTKSLRTLALLMVLFTLSCSTPATKENDATDTTKVSTTENTVARYGSITGLKAEKLDYYKKLHAAVWPQVLKTITDCNIRNYSIYLKKINDKYYLFSYFEYTGKDFAADMKKMAADSTTTRWWKETDPCQQPLPDAAAKKETWSSAEEVFHMD